MKDDGGEPRLVDVMVADEPLAGCGVCRGELERDAVAARHVPQVVAAGGPLLADDAVDQVPGPVGDGPGGQGLLDLRVDPFLWGDPSLEDEEVDPPQGGRPRSE